MIRGLCLAALVLATACTSSTASVSQDPSSAQTSSASAAAPTRDALEAAVHAYSDAFLSGDAEAAWNLLSTRCRDRVARSDFNATVQAAAKLYSKSVMSDLVVDELSGPLARVTYEYDNAAINQDHEPWVFEDGSWHEDDC
jgi:hypothetical protein